MWRNSAVALNMTWTDLILPANARSVKLLIEVAARFGENCIGVNALLEGVGYECTSN